MFALHIIVVVLLSLCVALGLLGALIYALESNGWAVTGSRVTLCDVVHCWDKRRVIAVHVVFGACDLDWYADTRRYWHKQAMRYVSESIESYAFLLFTVNITHSGTIQTQPRQRFALLYRFTDAWCIFWAQRMYSTYRLACAMADESDRPNIEFED